ncbi:RluA family pseudouridine synthase [Streptomyces sp. NBC_01020]|uniref:RluA family pseudouridine synthase n=1 Tax=unclassified Streptomyces TaxID=2593676 RepID=UPI00324738BC|nr:RluA family pseudouridine synthase [Streptomyces sp. NBC_01020]WSX70830.1 RluA family pseudouridine synthase [Streptomyces sp. NBC_00932]
MRRKTSRLPGPLPQREGIDAVRLRLPVDGAWTTVREHLAERLPGGAAEVDAMLRRGAFVGVDGPVLADTPYLPGASVWFHRDFPDEVPVPFAITVRYRDEHIVVADKPHFLATTPRGRHITQTALARLRKDLGLPALSPAHRLDRLTAGLVLFSVRPEERGAYQTLFRDRKVHKEYEGVAPYRAGLELPHVSRSRIEKVPGIVAAFETPGEPNSETRIEAGGRRGDLARYRLTPVTGRTHQLRVHMNALGVPLLGDPFFPVVTDPPPDDFRRPLQLLARVLEFTDPVTGTEHRFESGRSLLAWTAYDEWAAGR